LFPRQEGHEKHLQPLDKLLANIEEQLQQVRVIVIIMLAEMAVNSVLVLYLSTTFESGLTGVVQ